MPARPRRRTAAQMAADREKAAEELSKPLDFGRAEVVLDETFEVAEYVPAAPVWTVRATHAFEDWRIGEVREVIPDARIIGMVGTGFLELIDDGTHQGSS